MNTVLILGASVFQTPLIKKAKEMGCRTLVASVKGNYPGIALADKFFDADTTDTKKILAISKQNNIKAILTSGTDVSVPTLGAVADELNLTGPSAETAAIVSSKTEFRKFLTLNHLNGPDFKACRDSDTAWEFYSNSQKKLVIKPEDASGSRGVSVLNLGLSRENLNLIFQNAKNFSRNGLVCVEEFVEGKEVGGDAFLLNGEFAFFTTTHKHMNGMLVKGHSLPGSLSKKAENRVKNEILAVSRSLGYQSGPLNFDVMISSEKVVVLEMGLRNGGNGIVDIIKHAYDVDLTQMYLGHSLGKDVQIVKNFGLTNNASSLVFGSAKSGQIKSITGLEDLKKQVPEVIGLVLAKKPGEFIESFSNNANLAGYLILNCGYKNFESVRKRVEETLKITIK